MNIIFDIPPEYLENGKTLLIEKHDEIYVDGCHLSKPSRFIRLLHGLCLIDTQQQDLRLVNYTHQLESTIEDNRKLNLQLIF